MSNVKRKIMKKLFVLVTLLTFIIPVSQSFASCQSKYTAANKAGKKAMRYTQIARDSIMTVEDIAAFDEKAGCKELVKIKYMLRLGIKEFKNTKNYWSSAYIVCNGANSMNAYKSKKSATQEIKNGKKSLKVILKSLQTLCYDTGVLKQPN